MQETYKQHLFWIEILQHDTLWKCISMSAAVRYIDTRACLFLPDEDSFTLFLRETIVACFLYLIICIYEDFINHYSKRFMRQLTVFCVFFPQHFIEYLYRDIISLKLLFFVMIFKWLTIAIWSSYTFQTLALSKRNVVVRSEQTDLIRAIWVRESIILAS